MSALKNLINHPHLLFLLVLMAFGLHSNAQAQLKVLPLGNSITRGSQCLNGDIYDCVDRLPDSQAVGYRNRLYNLLSGSGYNVDFVGNNKYGYSIMSDPDNAGFSGIKSGQLADVMATGSSSLNGQVTPGPYLDYYPAEIVLLHIGTNDVLAGELGIGDVSRLLDAIDDYEVSNGKTVLVFLAKILSKQNVPCNSDPDTKLFNSRLVSMAQGRISSGDKLVIVDMECGAGFNYYTDLIDQAHPTQTGYDKMADKWFEAINGYNAAPVVYQIPNQVVDRGTSFTQINLDNYVTDAEDSPQDMTWSFYPSDPDHFTITIDENRMATVVPKDPQWSGSESIEFVAMDQGKVVSGLQKTDNCITQFTINWIPEITGQQSLYLTEGQSLEITKDLLVILEPEKAPANLTVIVEQGSNYTVNGTTITPVQNFFGNLSVPVKLVDNGKQSNTYPLVVEVDQVNFPPEITSSPVLTAQTNNEYVYSVTANDPDPGDVLTYSASQKPTWLYINPGTGVLSGTPNQEQVGFHNVSLEVSDGHFQDEQSFTVEVKFQNQAPQIITEPLDSVLANETYTYGILANDPDNDPITYFASALPEWLAFYPAAQVLIGIPDKSDAGENWVILGATDQVDTSFQAFPITVSFVSGILESETGQVYLIYPNPVSEQFIINLGQLYSSGEEVYFELFDLTGKKVMERKLTDPQTEIRISGSGISDGVYVYQMTIQSDQNQIISGKIIIRASGGY